MKAKLLKKVRKHISIVNYPNGVKTSQLFVHLNTRVQTLTLNNGNNIMDYCVVAPTDEPKYSLHGVRVYKTEKEAFKYLQTMMIYRVLSMYEQHGIRRIAKRKVSQKLYLK